VIDVDVREEDRVRPGAEPLEFGGQPPLGIREEIAVRRADGGVDEDRSAAASDQERPERHPPAIGVEELRVALPPARPVVLAGVGKAFRIGRERRLGVKEGVDLAVAGYHRTRGGAGSPWPSSHEITGFLSTPIPSISASITSPGFR
jgi:hypothetical protein